MDRPAPAAACRFAVALEGEKLCAACLATPPAFDSARAILAYDEQSRGAILALKHADRLDLVPGFARWLGRSGRSLLERQRPDRAGAAAPLAAVAAALQSVGGIGAAAGAGLEAGL